MSTNEHHMDWPPSDPKVVKEELIQTTKRGSSILKKVSWVMAILGILGVVGLLGKFFVDGDDQTQWGYVAASLDEKKLDKKKKKIPENGYFKVSSKKIQGLSQILFRDPLLIA